MIRPLVLLVYERLLPGGQLVNRLQDLGYRVQSATPSLLPEQCQRDKPLLVIADLEPSSLHVPSAIASLKQHGETAHIPVIAFAPAEHGQLLEAGRAAGATLVVKDSALLPHLDQFLEQALQVE
jgi:CheY-like chemotaxis protein